MATKVVIEGEAPETDSEEEATPVIPERGSQMAKSVQGATIAGEDTESDEEAGASVSSGVSALGSGVSAETGAGDRFSSLLHRKLRERNRSLGAGVRQAAAGAASEAARSLAGSEQQLLRSQVALQSAIATLRTLRAHAQHLQHRMQHIAASHFFHDVQLPSANQTPLTIHHSHQLLL